MDLSVTNGGRPFPSKLRGVKVKGGRYYSIQRTGKRSVEEERKEGGKRAGKTGQGRKEKENDKVSLLD